MSNLFNREKRALNKKLKKERMERILVAAHRAFLRFAYFEVTLDSIRKLADVPAGKPELYFGTREDLFLRVLAEEAKGWAIELESTLVEDNDPIDPTQVSEILTASVQLHPDYFRLRGLLPMVLEQQIETVSVMSFTSSAAKSIRRCATALNARCHDIDVDAGIRLLLLLGNYGSSLYQATHESGAMNRLWNDRHSSGYRLEFLEELHALVDSLVAQAIR